MKRRTFLTESALVGGAIALSWTPVFANKKAKKIHIGLIADLHHDIMHDGEQRLAAFIEQANDNQSDFIIQMGDFCRPYDHNLGLIEEWEKFKGLKFHILGNHDTDGGFTREQAMEFWGMQERYYSFDHQGIHFVILDGNDPNPKPWSGYHRYINKEQQDWLREDLAKTNLSTLVFSHQTLENEVGGVANLKEIQMILEDANRQAGGTKVVASLCGHHHTDYMREINGIYYIQINSASYRWVGSDYEHVRYSAGIDEKYPYIKYTIPYKDPLFTFLEIDPKGVLKIEPKKSEFVGLGPEEMGMPAPANNDPIIPQISGFKFKYDRI